MINELLIKRIEEIINEKIKNIEKLKIGYSRNVFLINNKYVLKIANNSKKEDKEIKEIEFLSDNNLDFIPKIIYSDFKKDEFPYVYHIEEKFNGELLLYKWKSLSKIQKKYVLSKLMKKLELLHSLNINSYCSVDILNLLLEEYNKYFDKIVSANILSNDKIRYLKELKSIIPELFKSARSGIIHGDLHFNNILINDNLDIMIIDFENLQKSFIAREFDPIYRMSRDPNSFNQDLKVELNKDDFKGIMNFIINNLDDIEKDSFKDRLLLFDCMNSLKWLQMYPDYELYNEILFDKSRNLLK